MRLSDVVATLDLYGDDLTIFVTEGGPLTPNASCVVVDETEAPEGARYVLEVDLAREAIAVPESWRSRPLSADERIAAVIYYAENDAYLPST